MTSSSGAKAPAVRKRDPEDVKRRILQAAVSEFAEHSYSGARIDRISKRAKTVDRMLYYYVGSKERLYQAVLEHVYAELVAAQRGFTIDDDDPVGGLRSLIRQSWRHYLEHPELVRLIVTENLLRARYFRKSARLKRTLLPLLERVREVLAAGQARRLFRADADPQQTLMTVMSLAFFYVANQHTCSRWLDTDLMQPDRLDAWCDHICDVVLDNLLVVPRPVAGALAAVRGRGAA